VTLHDYPGVRVEIETELALLTILDPGYDLQNLRSIGQAVRALEQEPDVRAIVLRGKAGTFSIGASYPLLQHMCVLEHASLVTLIKLGQDNVRSLLQSSKLTAAYVEGFAAGGGVDLLLACDRILFTQDTRINLFYGKLGAIPDDGALYLLAARVGWPKAIEWTASSPTWRAEEGIVHGIADTTVAAGMSPAALQRELRRELRLPSSTRAALKALRWSQIEASFESHLAQAAELMASLLARPEQQELIARMAAAQRMQSATKPDSRHLPD
jgi:enoyl-CoA hydratase/carnithine racemase